MAVSFAQPRALLLLLVQCKPATSSRGLQEAGMFFIDMMNGVATV